MYKIKGLREREKKTYFFWITVEEKINHHLPAVTSDGSTKTKNFTSQHPPHQSNRMRGLVITWNSNIYKT